MMSTGVVVNGYEIRNWHTVSLLELARARQTQERGREPVVVEEAISKRRNRNIMKETKLGSQMKISYGQACKLNARYLGGESLAEIAGEYGITMQTAVNYFKRLELMYPRPKVTEEAPAVPEDALTTATPLADETQMDDPETAVAAAASVPATEDVTELAKTRARELHQSRMVIAAEPLVLARKQYNVPCIVESGLLLEMSSPHAAAKMVEALVAKLNEVPGFQAYFEWRTEGQVGQPLAR